MKKERLYKWLFAAGTILLIGYLIFIGIYSTRTMEQRLCEGIYIQVIDSANQKFVTTEELTNELGQLPFIARQTPVNRINTDSLYLHLSLIDKIENVEVMRLTDGSIRIVVEPMRPVARVFEPDRSYYINKDGKKISADARYRIDVPVVKGHFTDTLFTAKHLIPLVKYISQNERWNSLVTMIEVKSPHDIFIIPAIREIVFNIGEPDNFDSKFKRMERMLDEVLPTKGWNFYDTISVKWDGQIVATRRNKVKADTAAKIIEIAEVVDLETMSAGEGIAVGQALPGHKANNETPIPGAKKANTLKQDSTATKQPETNKQN